MIAQHRLYLSVKKIGESMETETKSLVFLWNVTVFVNPPVGYIKDQLTFLNCNVYVVPRCVLNGHTQGVLLLTQSKVWQYYIHTPISDHLTRSHSISIMILSLAHTHTTLQAVNKRKEGKYKEAKWYTVLAIVVNIVAVVTGITAITAVIIIQVNQIRNSYPYLV